VELPPKIPYYASVFVVANARKQVIGKDVLEFAVGKVKELIEEGNLVSGKLMLRFLAGLSRIVEGQGVMDVIGEIVSKIEGQQPNVLCCERGNVDFRRGRITWLGWFC
jgi:hypothetical protein